MVNRKTENDSAGFVFLGGGVHEQWMASALRTSVLALRPSEPSLGTLSPVDQNWLVAAIDHLIRIDKSRRAENAHGNSYCIFEAGRIYFQCLAPSFGTYLRCESVSEKFVPEVASILTQAKRSQLVYEFGFAAPGYSKNFSQKIEIKGMEDLAYVARLAFRVLRDVYDVKDFAATQFKLTLLKPALPVAEPGFLSVSLRAEPLAEKPYVVFVDDNFHFMKRRRTVQERRLHDPRRGRKEMSRDRRWFLRRPIQAGHVVGCAFRTVCAFRRRSVYPRSGIGFLCMGLREAAL